jgi:hypothetical protein
LLLVFKALQDPPAGVHLALRVRQGHRTLELETFRDPNRLPVQEWRAGEIARISVPFRLRGLVPGELTMELGVLSRRGGRPLPWRQIPAGDAHATADGWLALAPMRFPAR